MNEPETFFVRHTDSLRIDDETRKQLWEERRIGVHFPFDRNDEMQEEDNSSLNPDDYKDGRHAMELLVSLAMGGGYVCAEHAHHGTQVGWVTPGSPIEILRGQWSQSERPGRTALLKTIRLERARTIEPKKALRVTVGRPQQGTIRKWRKCKGKIRDLVEGRRGEASLDDLVPTEQEVMCAEFLRLAAAQEAGLPRLQHLLLPVGRTMKDVDIDGIGVDGKEILGQVTYRSDEAGVMSKLAALKKYADDGSHLVLFTNAPQVEEPNVKIFSIDKVFELFRGTNAGKRWIDIVCGPDN